MGLSECANIQFGNRPYRFIPTCCTLTGPELHVRRVVEGDELSVHLDSPRYVAARLSFDFQCFRLAAHKECG